MYETGTGHLFPTDGAYTTAALVAIGAMAVTAMTSLCLSRQRAPEAETVAVPAGAEPWRGKPVTGLPKAAAA